MRDEDGKVQGSHDQPSVTGPEKSRQHIPTVSAHYHKGVLPVDEVTEQFVAGIALKQMEFHSFIMLAKPFLHLERFLDGLFLSVPDTDHDNLFVVKFGEEV